jgi:hypothetical protein
VNLLRKEKVIIQDAYVDEVKSIVQSGILHGATDDKSLALMLGAKVADQVRAWVHGVHDKIHRGKVKELVDGNDLIVVCISRQDPDEPRVEIVTPVFAFKRLEVYSFTTGGLKPLAVEAFLVSFLAVQALAPFLPALLALLAVPHEKRQPLPESVTPWRVFLRVALTCVLFLNTHVSRIRMPSCDSRAWDILWETLVFALPFAVAALDSFE